ncbi:hypothetical protein ACGFX4_11385 [Kitasatospora sp. NPDC048365]|uniref:hypothetical protein n=1 Tax=Kitasatospora sp. NPDC048365 TaxID=3364050 RepID=UPI00371350AF
MSESTRQSRLTWLMTSLLQSGTKADVEPYAPPARDVVAEEDALMAVLIIASQLRQTADVIGPSMVEHLTELLVLVRDYIRPLPPAPDGPDCEDLVTPDLESLVVELRSQAAQVGLYVGEPGPRPEGV